MLKTYIPWSKQVLDFCIAKQTIGEIPAIDLELTAKCTKANCIYCDSKPSVGRKQKGELSSADIVALVEGAASCGCKWIYTCGLGEPLEDDNFWLLVDEALKHGIRLSLFTNGLSIDERIAKALKVKNVCLIVKLDTLDQAAFDKILGVKNAARNIYKSIDRLLSAGYGQCENDELTDLAISIVPSKLSYAGIDDTINFAIQNNIFPSIGELEQAGRLTENDNYQSLAISPVELQRLKMMMDTVASGCYSRPFCPSIFTGIHIDSKGNCCVDNLTGLNCKWFLLEDPDLICLGNIKSEAIKVLAAKVFEYRKKCFKMNSDAIDLIQSKQFEFGGCGGSPHAIISIAREILSQQNAC